MKQNIYDNPAFFDAYMEFRRTDAGFNGLLEEPTMISLLPDIRGKRVLDIGCGTGRLCRYLAKHGASCVLGIDPSERMLAVVRSESIELEERLGYHRTFVEDFDTPVGSFDLIVSSLALHYVEDIVDVFQRVFHWLSPKGTFTFSVEHPIYAAAGPGKWLQNSEGGTYWAVGHYFSEGQRKTSWLVDGVIKYHRTVDTMVNRLIDAGFVISRMVEPRLDRKTIAKCIATCGEMDRPSFLFIKCIRGDSNHHTCCGVVHNAQAVENERL